MGAKDAALHVPVVVCNGYINHRVDAYGAWLRLINSCGVIKFDAEGHWPFGVDNRFVCHCNYTVRVFIGLKYDLIKAWKCV